MKWKSSWLSLVASETFCWSLASATIQNATMPDMIVQVGQWLVFVDSVGGPTGNYLGQKSASRRLPRRRLHARRNEIVLHWCATRCDDREFLKSDYHRQMVPMALSYESQE